MFESPWHWAVVALVAFVLFFGWKQLPDMARSLGRSLRIFKTEIKGMSEDDKARAKAREDAENAEPKALPAADIVKRENGAHETSEARPVDAVTSPRPRPRPSPNGQAHTSAKAE
jgi:sec-independent protein translocase protein TatA